MILLVNDIGLNYQFFLLIRATAMAVAAKSQAANLRPLSWLSPTDSTALEWLSPADSIALEWLVPMLMMPLERIAMLPMEAKPVITTRIPVGPI